MFDCSEGSRGVLTSSRPRLVSKLGVPQTRRRRDETQNGNEERARGHMDHGVSYKAEYGGHLDENVAARLITS